jgi:hypothetical protein
VVQIDAPCLDCGLPIKVQVKDGAVQSADPRGIVAYTPVPFAEWFNDIAYA